MPAPLLFALAVASLPSHDVGAPPAVPACEGRAGMRCVAGGRVSVGVGDTARTVTVPRFFIDEHVVSAGDYRKCVRAHACEPAAAGKGRGPVTVDWARAERYCAFAGKRLAQESEWEAAVQGGMVPTGQEWTNTWAVTPKTCPAPSVPIESASKVEWFPPARCGARDVLDACDGAVLCGTLHKRVWKDAAAPSARHQASSLEDGARKGFRCATSTTYLTTFPSRFTAARATPPDPKPPTAAEKAAFDSVVEDTLDVPPCPKAGRSFLTCRDPRSYLKSNEPKLGVLVPYVENMGGAYTGVGSAQSYTFVALARSRWAWLFDYDENVVRWHHVLRALILAAENRAAFAALFHKDAVARGVAAIEAAYPADAERANLVTLYKSSAPFLGRHYAAQEKIGYTWLGSDEHYAYIRLLYQQGRMRALRGNMLDVHAMKSIGDAARRLGVPVRIYYPSNAAEFWVFTDQYRKNVRGLPFDDDSIVVQTISGVSLKTGFGQKGYWHYNVQYGREQQALLELPGYTREKQLLWHRVKTDSPELTLCGMPAAAGP